MNETIAYGGDWTEKKLGALGKYLRAYLTVLKTQRFALHYIDAFAGPGLWQAKNEKNAERLLFDLVEQEETEKYKQGSPMIALDMPEPGFDRFVFVEKNEEYIASLKRRVREKYPSKIDKVQFKQNDANKVMRDLCDKWNTKSWRAVVFLDPFGMEVEWETIKAIAETQSMDLWVLFPLGMGVNRMLTRDGDKIDPAWEQRLDILFGAENWRERFYQSSVSRQPSLLGEPAAPRQEKVAGFNRISEYFIERLNSIFAGVVEEPLLLRNSKNNPLFALCFAAGNLRGAPIAVKIAKHIIGEEK